MKLKEIFDQLSYGELSQVSLGGDAGVISEENYPRILAHVNLGLTALHKRFFLKEQRIKLILQPGTTTYSIKSQFAVNNRRSREPIRYLADTEASPFGDNVMKIERVITDDKVDLPLNDGSNPLSVMTPSLLTLTVPEILLPGAAGWAQLPDELKTTRLDVVYRANHPMLIIPVGFFDPSRVEVDIPESHLEALLYYVASRFHTPIGMSNEGNTGNTFYAKYEASCQSLEMANLNVDRGEQSSRFRANGWC